MAMNYVDNELRQIDEMTGDDFENYMTNLLSEVGYKNMVHTPMVNDHGLDAYGYTKDGTKIGFQFKRFQERVPYLAIYETIGGARFYHTKINILITNNFYANKTIKTCKAMNQSDPDKPILLWNRYKLRFLIYKVYIKKQKKIKEQLKKQHNIRNKIRNQKKLVHYQQLRNNQFVKKVSHLLMSCNFLILFTKNTSNLDIIGKKHNKTTIGIKFILNQNTYVSRKLIYNVINHMNINKAKEFTRIFIITDGLIEARERTKTYNHFKSHIFILRDHKDMNDLSSSFGIYISKFVNKHIIHKTPSSKSSSSIKSSKASSQSSFSKISSLINNSKSNNTLSAVNKSSSSNLTNKSKAQHRLKASRTFAKIYYSIKENSKSKIKARKNKLKNQHILHKQLIHANKFVGNNVDKPKTIYTQLLCKTFKRNVINYLRNNRNCLLHKTNYFDFGGYDSYGKRIAIKFFTFTGSSMKKVKYIHIYKALMQLETYLHSLNTNKKYKILFITNKTFTPDNAVKAHNDFPNIYLRDYNLANLKRANQR